MRGLKGVTVMMLAVIVLAAVPAGADELGSQLKQRVTEVLAGTRPLSEVRLDVVWASRGRNSLTVYGSGVGVWNQEKQFKLSSRQHKKLLERLVERDYFAMPERPKPTAAPERVPQGPRVLRSVTLRVGDLERSVLQTDRVPALAVLESLVGELFDLCESEAGKGFGAASLADGLSKVAKGELAPETLRATLNLPPIAASGAQPAQAGVIVTVEGGVLTWTSLVTGGLPASVRSTPSAERVRALADVLSKQGFSAFPVNLYRARYVDVGVTVLNRSHSVMARPFAGLDPGKHAAQQEAMEKVIDAVLALQPSGGAASASDQGI